MESVQRRIPFAMRTEDGSQIKLTLCILSANVEENKVAAQYSKLWQKKELLIIIYDGLKKLLPKFIYNLSL